MQLGHVADANRRETTRVELSVPVEAGVGDIVTRGVTSNLSAGGACLQLEGQAPEVGDTVSLRFVVPGTDDTVSVDAEVRWTASKHPGRCGVRFHRGHQRFLKSLLGVFLVGITSTAYAATTTVPTFDPDADIVLDMQAGGERPDNHSVLMALTGSYDAIDACVVESRKAQSKRIAGEAHVEVLLNPQGATPLGVNAELPKQVAKNRKLKECVRAAVAGAPYPSYDGPPVVVEVDLELDPGDMEIPEE